MNLNLYTYNITLFQNQVEHSPDLGDLYYTSPRSYWNVQELFE